MWNEVSFLAVVVLLVGWVAPAFDAPLPRGVFDGINIMRGYCLTIGTSRDEWFISSLYAVVDGLISNKNSEISLCMQSWRTHSLVDSIVVAALQRRHVLIQLHCGIVLYSFCFQATRTCRPVLDHTLNKHLLYLYRLLFYCDLAKHIVLLEHFILVLSRPQNLN